MMSKIGLTHLIGISKDKLGGKTITEFDGLRAKTWAYLMDGDSEHKKLKEKKSV